MYGTLFGGRRQRGRRLIAVYVSRAGELEERIVATLRDELARALGLPCSERRLLLSPDDGQKLYASRNGYDGARSIIESIPAVVEQPTHVSPYDPHTRRFRIVSYEPKTEPRGAIVGKVVVLSNGGNGRCELRLVTAFGVNGRWVSRRLRDGSLRELMPNVDREDRNAETPI